MRAQPERMADFFSLVRGRPGTKSISGALSAGSVRRRKLGGFAERGGRRAAHRAETGEEGDGPQDGRCQLDGVLSIEKERRLMLEAAFSWVDEVWPSNCAAVLAARV